MILLTYDNVENIPDRIREYMAENTKYKDFAVVSHTDFRCTFPDRAVWRGEYHKIVKGLTDVHVERAIKILNERSAFPYREWKD